MSDTTVGAVAFSEGYLGEFPTKIQEVPIGTPITPIPGSEVRKASPDYKIPKKMGRPKGSKNKPKDTSDDDTHLIETPAHLATTRWIHLLLKSEAVPEGLPMMINKWSIVGVSKLPSGGASVVADVGGSQPMILTTLTPYEEVVEKVESVSEF